MDNLGESRAKSIPQIAKAHVKQVPRVQLNSTVNADLATQIKILAARFGVPGYCVLEHLIQIGGFSLIKVLQDPEKQEIVQQHLVSHHLLGDDTAEDIKLLTLGLPAPFETLEVDIIRIIRVLKAYDSLIFGERRYAAGEFKIILRQCRDACWEAVNQVRHNFDDLREEGDNSSEPEIENESSTEIGTEMDDDGEEDEEGEVENKAED